MVFAVVVVGAQALAGGSQALAGPNTSNPASNTPANSPAIGSDGTVSTSAVPVVDLGPDQSIYYRGLWQEGKAVFSDWKALDILWGAARYKRGYRPSQPIAYSHQVHMEKNQMECTYCHSGVTKSNFATIPAVELCMGCHKTVKADSPEIKKLKEAFDKGQPVEWVPVNNLPEHVQFNHKRHLKAGVTCQTCHGMVQKMAVVERMSSFKMGFCVTCHRENGASIDCALCHY